MPPRRFDPGRRLYLFEVLELAEIVASLYARRVNWAAQNFEDVRQVAAMAGIEARQRYNPSFGCTEEGFLRKAMVYACVRSIWAQRVGLSGGKHRPEVAFAEVKVGPLPSQSPDEQDESLDVVPEVLQVQPADTERECAETAAEREQRRLAIRRRLFELAPALEVLKLLDLAEAGSLQNLQRSGMVEKFAKDAKLRRTLKNHDPDD